MHALITDLLVFEGKGAWVIQLSNKQAQEASN